MAEKTNIEFRNFELDDLEIMLQIIDDIGIEEFKECFKDIKLEKNPDTGKVDMEKIDIGKLGIDIGFKIISKIIKNAKKCLDSLYLLISKLSNLELEDAKRLSLVKVSSELIKIFQKEENQDFLKLVSSLKK